MLSFRVTRVQGATLAPKRLTAEVPEHIDDVEGREPGPPQLVLVDLPSSPGNGHTLIGDPNASRRKRRDRASRTGATVQESEMKSPRQSNHGMKRLVREGQVMILFAVASMVLIGMAALAVDVGVLFAERRQVQSAADAGALAAAKSVYHNQSGQVVAAARAYASENAGVAAGDVTVNWPPTSGSHSGDDDYVQVSVEKDVQKYFLGAIYSGTWSVTASAVAAIEDDPANYALIALEAPGIDIPGNAYVDITGEGASAMSNDAITSSGVSNGFTVGGSIDANGTIEENSGWVAPRGFNEDMRTIDDPIVEAGVTPPTAGSLPARTIADISPADCFSGPPKDCTLQPGYYENLGDLLVRRTWTLQPGVYYFEGTSVSFQNTTSRIEGAGVLMYFDGSSSSTYLYPKNGEIAISGPTSAPYTGGLAGMALWVANCSDIDAGGNTVVEISGIWYAPCSEVDLHGTPSNDTVHGQLIVGNLNVVGNSNVNITYEHYVDTFRPKVFLVQ